MKSRFLPLLCLCTALALGGCAPSPSQPAAPSTPSSSQEPGSTDAQLPPSEAQLSGRVLAVSEKSLLLAGEAANEVYALSPPAEMVPLHTGNGEGVTMGDWITVAYDGSVLETWPARLGTVTGILVDDAAFDDLSLLYLQVLCDLWDRDAGLNEGAEILGVDLSQTRLTPAEQQAVAYLFGLAQGREVVTGTLDELTKAGYITEEPLPDTGAVARHWETGSLFSITETEAEAGQAAFSAQKWRSGTGAYFFTNCTASQNDRGHWAGYEIGAEAIS